jgi:hypothetical protein
MDTEERVKSGIIAGLELVTEEVPFAGAIFVLLVEQLWPEGAREDPWEQIKERVEALIGQKLSHEVYQRVKGTLAGLKKNSLEFSRAASHPDSTPAFITEKFNIAKGFFNQEAENFREEPYEVLLLPLFAQMANLHLALLREGCLRASRWGWSHSDTADVQADMKTTVKDYTEHVDKWYKSGLAEYSRPGPDDGRGGLSAFNRQYGFIREMTASVLDYRTLWPYMDPVRFPTPVQVHLSGELYSDAYGDARPGATRDALEAARTQFRPQSYHGLTRIQVWASTKIDAVKLWYAGAEQAKMPSDSTGGAPSGSGDDFDLSQRGRPTSFCVYPWDAVWGLGLWFANGSSRLMGFYGHPDDRWGYYRDPISPPPGYYISGITVIGPNLARVIFFRYRYDNGRGPDMIALSPGTELPMDVPYSTVTTAGTLVFQNDGNLVVYDENKAPRWASNTQFQGKRCVFEQDGDLVVYDDKGEKRFRSQTNGRGATLWIQSNGDVAVRDKDLVPIWRTSTDH